MRALFGILLAFLVATTGCAEEPTCTVPEGVDPDWVRTIRCEHDYSLLWDERDDSVFARTRTINWLVDREDGDRTYFIDTEEWRLHYFFADAYLNLEGKTPVGTHGEFNILNYRRQNRRFLLGKLVHYRDQEIWALEMSAGDTADADMIVEAYHLIAAELYNGEELVYRPVSNDQEEMLEDIAARIPVIRTEDVFLGQSYQPLNQRVGYGTLRFRRVAELGGRPVGPTDIAVLDRVPNDISLVSGIITSEFQTPLSHVNILSKNRGTPNMAARGVYADPDLRALEDQLVRIEVGPQDFTIAPAELAEAQVYWDSLRPEGELVPDFDDSVDTVVDLEDVGVEATVAIGAKAANLGEMTRIGDADDPVPLPQRPFAIPFSFYRRHLEANGLDTVVADLLADFSAGSLDETSLRERLFDLRWQIYRAPIDPADLAAVLAAIDRRWPADTRLRFRSSTNVEDLSEFSGAGLYTSAASSLLEGDAAIADAIKVVWASAWNHQAFVERDFYRVDHERVRMGILVHPAFVDELANGVAVTINEFAENRPAFYINSQVGEVSVTNPTGAAVPEQILYYTWYEEPEYEVITRSSLLREELGWPGGASVFTDAELADLAGELERIHRHFKGIFPARADFAMDVEFKLAPGRRLVIKQARPLARPAP